MCVCVCVSAKERVLKTILNIILCVSITHQSHDEVLALFLQFVSAAKDKHTHTDRQTFMEGLYVHKY